MCSAQEQLIAVANPEDFYAGVDQKTGLTTSIYLATPIVSQEEILGVLTFVNRPDDAEQERFDQAEIEWSMRLADLTASALRYYPPDVPAESAAENRSGCRSGALCGRAGPGEFGTGRQQ